MRTIAGPLAVAVAFLLALSAASCTLPGQPAGESRKRAFAIEHVTVLPMTHAGARRADATVIIRDGRIVAIEDAAQARVPADAERVDGRGKFLMPGLTDMHVHIQGDDLIRHFYGASAAQIPDGTYRAEDVLTPFVANGVLQVLNLTSDAATKGYRDAVSAGEIVGPHIVLGVMVDGDPPQQPRGVQRIARTPDEGREAVRAIEREGYDVVKTYGALNQETFAAIVAQARQDDVPVIGHLPNARRSAPEQVLIPGFGLIAHAEEVAQATRNGSDADIARYVELSRKNGTGLVSTIVLDSRIVDQTLDVNSLRRVPGFEYVHPYDLPSWFAFNRYGARNTPERVASLRAMVAFNARLARAFHAAGLPVYPGTDSMISGVIAGFSLHDELEALVEAGIPAETVLLAATSGASGWLRTSGERGMVEVGKRAELLLLDADPVVSVANTRRIADVFTGGKRLRRADLDDMLASLARRYAAMPPFQMQPPGASTAALH